MKVVQFTRELDELGAFVEMSWDLFPLVDADRTSHLSQDGLPKVGTRILPGMILIGAIGKSRSFDPNRQPSALEIHGLAFDEIRRYYGDMWVDASVYADANSTGVVKEAKFLDEYHASVFLTDDEISYEKPTEDTNFSSP